MGLRGLDLDGKVAVVVGATSGIGRVLALGLAQAGADVVPTGRRLPHVDEVAREVEALGRRTVRVSCDVTDAASLGAAREAIESALGRVDILVNSAGRTKRTPTLELPESEWDDILETNLTGTLRACRAFAPGMLARGWGRIINIASLQSWRAFAHSAPYGAGKGGVVQLTRAIAQEWGGKGITCNAIGPGFFPTALTAPVFADDALARRHAEATCIGRNGALADLHGAAVFLASEASAYVTGQTLMVDGGYTAR